MKILITGASGYLGKILSTEFSGHNLVLWSRRNDNSCVKIDCICGDLDDCNWWSKVQLPEDLDVVIHLAEVVKANKSKDQINKIIDSHTLFLERCCKNAPLVVYPDTAYKYDAKISANANAYLEIKTAVIERLYKNKNFYHPVIHPVLNGRGALAKLFMLQKKIPCVNIFSNFDAVIPYSTELSMVKSFKGLLTNNHCPSKDWYCGIIKISELMAVKGRMDILWVSSIIKLIVHFFKFHPSVNVLIVGRGIESLKGFDK